MSNVTLKDIAKLANISPAAVSIILNDKPSRISETKKQEVKKIAKELNYRPNKIARSLLGTPTKTIGVLIPDIENPFFSRLVRIIEREMSIKGYSILIANSNDIFKNDINHINEFLERQVDGIIICVANETYLHLQEFRDFIMKIDSSIVFVDRFVTGVSKGQVVSDNRLGGFLATSLLLKKGIKEISIVTGKKTSFISNERLKGVKDALEHSNKEIKVNYYEGDFHYESGMQIGMETDILKESTGIFCFNDLMAYGILSANKIKKISNLQIIGYDNLRYAEMFGVQLLSVNQNINQLAEEAVKMLQRTIEEGDYTETIYLKPYL